MPDKIRMGGELSGIGRAGKVNLARGPKLNLELGKGKSRNSKTQNAEGIFAFAVFGFAFFAASREIQKRFSTRQARCLAHRSRMAARRIVLAGGSGFLGHLLGEYLQPRGWEPVI